MKSKTISFFAALLMAATLVPMALAAGSNKGDIVAQVTQLEKDSVKADLAGDASFLSDHATDDYTAGSSWGVSETKASMLKDMSDSQANKINKEEISELRVRAYGNTAIATFNESYDSLYHGEHRVRTTLCTDTWVKQAQQWKLVAGHCSELAK
jgi:ketosteroid isomerase-like protein